MPFNFRQLRPTRVAICFFSITRAAPHQAETIRLASNGMGSLSSLFEADNRPAFSKPQRLKTKLIRPTGEHGWCLAGSDEVGRVGNGLQPGWNTTGNGRVDAAQPMPNRCLSGGGIDDGIGKIHRADMIRPSHKAAPVKLGNRARTAKHGAEDESDILLVPHLLGPTAVGQSDFGRRDDKAGGPI